ncbi:PREDICTED: eukaryotic translation initiation factor 5B [Nanorana parkeri]|uniref:eukaryotic translation initiation factor 5B n=1 Tax=Nanorana parkeri TaxID=125878 RepID=UPI00085403FD|nr:PREDICTED: eukaryotic translation initiation factor 5B [Nanorana parkeri]
MGKKQKSKTDDSAKDDADLDALAAEIEGAGASKDQKAKGKKKKDKKKPEFDEDDILKELEELSLETQGGKSNKDSVPKAETEDPDAFDPKQDKKKKSHKAKKASVDDDDDSDEMESRNTKPRKPEKPQNLSDSDDDDNDDNFNKRSKKGKGKSEATNKKGRITEEAKDQDKEEADIPGDSDEDSDEFSYGKKGKKKEQKPKPAPKVESEEDEGEFKMKTAAQKKAEKKERERKKKEEDKAKLRKQKEKEEIEGVKEPAKAEVPEKKPEDVAAPQKDNKAVVEVEAAAAADMDEGKDDDGDKKKKDKKKKKGEKEEKPKDKKKKGPSLATVKVMQEALAKLKEEEERLKREEDERLKRLEEMEAKRLEEERLEQERKEKKKQKEKERKERLKKEGKLLTKTQKEARARAVATLNFLQAQGVEVPSKDGLPRKKPVYEDKKKKKPQQQTPTKEVSEPIEVSSPVEEVAVAPLPEKEETLLPAEPVEAEEDAGVDDWEARVSDEEKEKVDTKTVHIEVQEKNEEEEDDEEDEDEEDEAESDEDEEEEDEGESSEEEKSSDEKPADPQPVASKAAEKKPVKEQSSDSESESDDDRTKEEKAYDKAKKRIEKRRIENLRTVNVQILRSPVICVLGHVDTGKTKILDKLRHTHVQDGEAGGITQQIGATNVPLDALKEQTKMAKNFDRENMKIPGMLIIDTPGHESFSNLRNRGSSLCDIAILVVDIMHGLEPQTIESLNLLKNKKCPFIVALNKIDRLYDWKKSPETDVAATLKKQKKNTKDEFEERTKAIILEFAQQGLNAALFYENKDPRTFVSLVPTSAHSGDGMGNLICLLVELTQTMLNKRLAHSEELRAQVMEVKALPGMGTTIDVILINGRLREGDTIIVAGVEGPIVTQIRGLLLPPPMKELRVKNQYEKHKEVLAAQGVKILGKDLEKALAGLPLLVAHKDDEIPVLRDELIHELKQTLNAIKLEEKGVYVQASTLGSLEALLEFLKTSEVPYAGINIGPVHKKDVMKASVMLEHDPQYAVILAFDVRIEREAQEMADSLGVRIFSAEIIYHLFDAFTKYRQDYKKQKQEEFKHIAVFPCKIRILPQFIFNSRDPIVMGVIIEAGQVKQGTPICVPSKSFVDIGIITSIEMNHKAVDVARKGQEICIKIEPIPGESPKMFGRHFEATDHLVSKINRQSIDALKNWFRDEMQKSDWQLIVELKKVFEII